MSDGGAPSILRVASMDLRPIEARVTKLIGAFEDILPREQVLDMRELAAAGEPGIALENMCMQLYEYDIPVSSAQILEVASLCKSMELPDSTWQDLRQSSR